MTWRELGYEFTQYTTLHGLRYIAERNTFIARRIFWLLLTVTCSSLMVVQVVDRVQYLLQSPIAVNIKVNYNQSLQFPAITICNQNAFRATEASDLDLYRLIEDMYRTGRATSRNISWLENLHKDIRVDQLYTKLGHRKEDFIVSCSWAGESCSADNFTTTLTDHGMCYTFNGYNERTPQLNVSFSGAEHGLRLTLNAERYDAMPGPHDANGIKILATSVSEFPRVEEIGIAIPTGAHAFVGLGVLVIKNLPKPHGDCGDKTLLSTKRYSPEMCILECVSAYVSKECKCRNFYMPNLSGNLPVCTVEQYYVCYLRAYEYIRKKTVDECDCPTSCNYQIYESSISYATTSANVKGNQLGLAKSEDLKNKFYRAREVTAKMNPFIQKRFKDTVQKMIENYNKLRQLFAFDILERLDKQIRNLEQWRADMTSKIDLRQFIYEYQEYSIQKNFMRARDAMEERTLNNLCFGFHEHVFNTELLLRQMIDTMKNNETTVSKTIKTYLSNTLQSKIETAERAFQNYTQIYTAYETGQRIFNYKFRKIPRDENEAIIPKPLLRESLYHNYYAKRYSKRVGKDIKKVLRYTRNFGTFADESFANTSGMLDVQAMEKISARFIDACEDYFHSKSTFYFETVDRPLRIIQERQQNFSNIRRDFDKNFREQADMLRTLKNSLSIIRSGFLSDLANGIQLVQDYFDENSTKNVTKRQLAQIFTSKGVSNDMHMLSLFFTEIRQKGQYIYQQWTQIGSSVLKVWSSILNDNDSVEYYTYKNMTDFLQNYTDVAENVSSLFEMLKSENDLRNVLRNTDNVFIKAIETLTEELRQFLQGSEMGETFIQDNFIQLDIYYKELRHEEIEQQRAYDAIALLCDIGGSIGLFIGASVMTVFEILDFIINNALINTIYRNKRK
ncbi:acid-sensing ion channel 2-like [Ruditapes philippinarum]|uniref:acid-sensing ion channel 2-like n=1 Tax=Ruditapes philippinarum TaxID=129788 RepID=UPI00295A6B98|nr:acid-sensing ion channel 2-like [Ruditapes philippinarum]